MAVHLPEVDRLLKDNDVEMSLLSVNWLLTAFASVFTIRVLLRVWDYLFVVGGVTIFRVCSTSNFIIHHGNKSIKRK